MKKLLFLSICSVNLLAQESYIDYVSPFHPTAVTGKNGMVVSQNYLSSDIGIEILDKGGNAVDAAVAVVWWCVKDYDNDVNNNNKKNKNIKNKINKNKIKKK